MCERLQNLDEKFNKVLSFLKKEPSLLSSRGLDLDKDEDIKKLKDKFESQRNKTVLITTPTTVSDAAVLKILAKSQGYDCEKLETIQEEHKLAMAAENKVGELLEMYIAEKLEPKGWIWCSGSFVKAIDFICPHDENSWDYLQIKNRDNTENSSSSKIRDGSEIQKWFRLYSKKGTTNWDKFPVSGEGLDKVLNEEDFLKFVEKTIKHNNAE
ncbi:MAG: SinI family restriction endonuclease [Neisseria sp.]|uniref:SinI family restriction endonuclease n=1 Tax=unclassified Neisseria TaxID=2623750 RepID=UPI0008A9EF4F|nr:MULTISPECIES: SinI family restriction endonuclease [unclassified Neisseria]MBF1270815.1 SinI family restriction endonuclease [Neisseria sp.]OHR11800.1 hypothetical protein HMPREF2596_10040 [Neisseria sp. HMSC078C12]